MIFRVNALKIITILTPTQYHTIQNIPSWTTTEISTEKVLKQSFCLISTQGNPYRCRCTGSNFVHSSTTSSAVLGSRLRYSKSTSSLNFLKGVTDLEVASFNNSSQSVLQYIFINDYTLQRKRKKRPQVPCSNLLLIFEFQRVWLLR